MSKRLGKWLVKTQWHYQLWDNFYDFSFGWKTRGSQGLHFVPHYER